MNYVFMIEIPQDSSYTHSNKYIHIYKNKYINIIVLNLTLVPIVPGRIHHHGSSMSSSKMENEPRSPGEDDDDEDLINPGSPTPFEDDASEDEVALELRSPLGRLAQPPCPPEGRTTSPSVEAPLNMPSSLAESPTFPNNSSTGSVVSNVSSVLDTGSKSSAFSSPFLNLNPNVDTIWDNKTCSRELFLSIPQTTLASDMLSHIAVDGDRNVLRPQLRGPLFPPFAAGLPPRLPFSFNTPLNHWHPTPSYPLLNTNGDYQSPFPHSLSIESLIAPKQQIKRPASPAHSPPPPIFNSPSNSNNTDRTSPLNQSAEHFTGQVNLSLERYSSEPPLRSDNQSPLSKRLHLSLEDDQQEPAKKLTHDANTNDMPSFYPIKLQFRKQEEADQ